MTSPIPNKNNGRIRSLMIWGIIILIMCLLWDNYTTVMSLQEKCTISQAIEASKAGKITHGFVKSDLAKREKWHILCGKAKTDKPVTLLNGQTRDDIQFEAEGKLTSKHFEDLMSSSNIWREESNNGLVTSILISI
ncbi:MAG: hypothetical protein LBQ03_00725, partial [Puniceicoccales bacterium]|nr:hypothetical protein [Puniceicoccales bacterium]